MNRLLRPGWTTLNLLALLAFLWMLPAASARAQSVSCTATMTAVNFGSVDLVALTGGTTAATLSYTCTNSANSTRYVSACFSIGDGSQGFATGFARRMQAGSTGNYLQFQLYWPDNSTVWGSTGFGSITPVNVPLIINRNSSRTGSVTVQARLLAGQSTPPPAVSYSDDFNGNHTQISHSESTSATPTTCTSDNDGVFGFTVNATVIKSCTVTAGATANIQLGAAGGVDTTATNITGSNAISVTCSSTTPYFVDLTPSNNSTTGAGRMAAMNLAPVTGNTDTVPYQLRSTTGMTGTIWGNTATSTLVGNGVAGTGTGANQSITVYATTPSANFRPDSYQDTVTVTVNY